MATTTEPTAQETITINTAAVGNRAAAHITLNVTYDTTQSRQAQRYGYFQVVSATGTYTEVNASGTVTNTYQITNLIPVHRIGNNDNRIYLNNPHIVDKHGLSFQIAYRPNRPGHFNFFESARAGHYTQLYEPYKTAYVTSWTETPGVSAAAKPIANAVLAATCFASGTRIRTDRGDVAVEALAVGDRVVTAAGALRPIRWLGHRTIDCRRHPQPALVLPVRIAAEAFGVGLPARDLVVSPGHAICVDVNGEALVPAGALVNGTTISSLEVERVTYWHVELDSHDVILSENLPTESYLEMSNRGFFAESGTVDLATTPDAAVRTHADFCRPFHGSGPTVDAARARLEARATEVGMVETTARAA